jgi:hypothetical protein
VHCNIRLLASLLACPLKGPVTNENIQVFVETKKKCSPKVVEAETEPRSSVVRLSVFIFSVRLLDGAISV